MVGSSLATYEMDEDQWMYDSIMSEEWARSVAHENGFVAVIIRSDTNTGSRGKTSFVLIDYERSDEYRCRKKEFVRRYTGTRKCGCPFKLRGKPVVGGQGWMMKLMCEIHNHKFAKSLVGHPYVGQLTKAEKTLIADMTKSIVKPRNILLTLKEHNANNCTTIKQIYNARSAYCSSIRGSDTEMQHLMKLLEWDQYIHWQRLKDEDVVRDIFWCHPDAVNKNPSTCGCVMRTTHGLPCACELSKYVVGCIPLDSFHMFWRRLSFSDQGLSEPEVSIKEETETISKRFEELNEIAYPNQNSMCPPPTNINTKGAPKKPMNRNPRSTKRDPSYWEYVDAFHSVQNSNSSVRRSASSSDQPNPRKDFIDNIVDVKPDGNCGYRSVVSLLGMGEDSWSLVCNHLKELGKFLDDCIKLFGGMDKFEELRMSLLIDGLTKWMDITDMGYVIASRYNVILVSLSQQQSMTFFSLRSQSLADSSVHRIIFYRSRLWQSSDQLHILVECNIIELTDKQYLDAIYYRQPFTDTGNQFCFKCMQLKNDDDVNTMLMCNHQFLCVGPIELLCTIGRTPNDILNLLEATMTPTHDALLYYNER
ncbi:hypothetical protein HKD37_12G034687 [Glycine soja]